MATQNAFDLTKTIPKTRSNLSQKQNTNTNKEKKLSLNVTESKITLALGALTLPIISTYEQGL